MRKPMRSNVPVELTEEQLKRAKAAEAELEEPQNIPFFQSLFWKGK